MYQKENGLAQEKKQKAVQKKGELKAKANAVQGVPTNSNKSGDPDDWDSWEKEVQTNLLKEREKRGQYI